MTDRVSNTLQTIRRTTLALILSMAVMEPPAAQQQLVTPNYVGTEIRAIIQAVSTVTGRNFIIDPRVRQEVTMISSTPMSPDAFYEAFLSILQVHGYAAVPSGDVIKIIPDASVRSFPTPDSPAGGDDIITQVVKVENVGAAQLVPILRPLIPQYGHLAAHPGSNMLIISDRANNVARMVNIIRRIDQSNDEDIEVIPLTNASAAEIVRVLTSLTQAPRADGAPSNTQLVADARVTCATPTLRNWPQSSSSISPSNRPRRLRPARVPGRRGRQTATRSASGRILRPMR